MTYKRKNWVYHNTIRKILLENKFPVGKWLPLKYGDFSGRLMLQQSDDKVIIVDLEMLPDNKMKLVHDLLKSDKYKYNVETDKDFKRLIISYG